MPRAAVAVVGPGALAALAMLPAAADQSSLGPALRALDVTGYASPTTPPDFAGQSLDGRALSLAGLRGRAVLLTFWATWCAPCREEMPALDRLHRDLAGEGLVVLGINVGEDGPTVLAFARELGLTFSLLRDPRGEIQASYGVVGLPTSFLIGRDGRAVGLAVGPRQWGTEPARALIRTLLAEPAPRGGRR